MANEEKTAKSQSGDIDKPKIESVRRNPEKYLHNNIADNVRTKRPDISRFQTNRWPYKEHNKDASLDDVKMVSTWMRKVTHVTNDTDAKDKSRKLDKAAVTKASQKLAVAAVKNMSTVARDDKLAQQKDAQVAANVDEEPAFTLPFDKWIPKDKDELRETSLYKSTYKLLQWQRDNYLVGGKYANRRRQYRETHPPDEPMKIRTKLPYDASALGHQQFIPILANFIPSQTVVDATVPLVIPLLQAPFGSLYPLAKDGLIDIIYGQQSNLDILMRDQLLDVLKNPDIRSQIKSSTQGYIATKYQPRDTQS